MKTKGEVDLIPELRAHIARKYQNQCKAAAAWGISTAMVSGVLHGKKSPPKVVLDDMGLEAVPQPVRYVKKTTRAEGD